MESKIKTFIFDIDGTLIDTYNASVTSLKESLKDVLGLDFRKNQLSFHFGITLPDALRRLNIDEKNFDIISKKIDEYYYKHIENITIFEGVEKMLRTLSKENVTLGIVTSKTREEFNTDFARLSIAKNFNIVICADDTIKHKPNPEPIEKFLEISKSDRQSAIYIGDTAYDLACARGAHIKFGLAMWGALNKEVETDYILNKPDDILNLK